MQLSQVDISRISLAAFASSKGVKTSACTIGGAPVEFLLHGSDWFSAPFGASAYQDPKATRLTMELDVTKSDVLPLLQRLEQHLIQEAFASGIFENESQEEIAKKFHSPLSFSDKYSSMRLRTKLNTQGMKSCKFYESPSRTQKPFEAFDLRESVVRPFMALRGLWKQGGQWGLQYEVLSLFIEKGAVAPCPF